MKITNVMEDQVATFVLEGRLDTTTAPELEQVLLPGLDEAEELVLDFEQLDYLSSAGLRVLLAAQKKANRMRKIMTIRNVNDTIMEVFEMTGFADILSIE